MTTASPKTSEYMAHNGVHPAGAITTVFTFPCRSDFWNVPLPSGCTPPSWNNYWGGAAFYSPAICPYGYTICSERWDTRQGPNVEATETAMMCAPSGYSCMEDQISYALSVTTSTFNLSDAAVPTVVSTLYNPLLQIRWAASDLCNLETHPTAPGVSHTGGCNPDYAWPTTATTSFAGVTAGTYSAGALQGAPSNPGSGDTLEQSRSSGLGTGAIVGIVLGVFFGTVFMLIGCLCIRRHRRKHLTTTNATALAASAKSESTEGTTTTTSELHGAEKTVERSELDPFPRQQVEPVELSATTTRIQQPWVSGIAPTSEAKSAAPVSPASPHAPEQAPELPAKVPLTIAGRAPPSYPETTVGKGSEDESAASELEMLRREHAQLETRRQQLLQLHQIEAQQSALQERMRELETRGPT